MVLIKINERCIADMAMDRGRHPRRPSPDAARRRPRRSNSNGSVISDCTSTSRRSRGSNSIGSTSSSPPVLVSESTAGSAASSVINPQPHLLPRIPARLPPFPPSPSKSDRRTTSSAASSCGTKISLPIASALESVYAAYRCRPPRPSPALTITLHRPILILAALLLFGSGILFAGVFTYTNTIHTTIEAINAEKEELLIVNRSIVNEIAAANADVSDMKRTYESMQKTNLRWTVAHDEVKVAAKNRWLMEELKPLRKRLEEAEMEAEVAEECEETLKARTQDGVKREMERVSLLSRVPHGRRK